LCQGGSWHFWFSFHAPRRAAKAQGGIYKQIGGELHISEITVKAHRGQVMRKMKAESLAALVKTAGRLR
jgi:FixJ family two-component response regulator